MEVELPGHEGDCACVRCRRAGKWVPELPRRIRRAMNLAPPCSDADTDTDPETDAGPDTDTDADPDTAAYLSSRLDEVHAAVLAARQRRSPSGQPGGLIEVEDAETFAELAELAKAWIHWLVDAARRGDPAARAHLRELGFDGPLAQT
jgi:hypothetical protein